MCSPKAPKAQVQEPQQVATPTLADANVTKSSKGTKNKTAALANRNIKTSARGLTDEATTSKKGLLGE